MIRHDRLFHRVTLLFIIFFLIFTPLGKISNCHIYSMSPKKSTYGFLNFFPKRLGSFNQFFTHLLCDDFTHFYSIISNFDEVMTY